MRYYQDDIKAVKRNKGASYERNNSINKAENYYDERLERNGYKLHSKLRPYATKSIDVQLKEYFGVKS